MIAAVSILQPRAIRVDETVAERAHRRSISIHCPNIDEMEMAARCDLAEMRDRASVGMARSNDTVAALLREVCALATQAVYAPIPTAKLMQIRSSLSLVMMGAEQLASAMKHG